jgi:hypothetical protein
MAVPPPKKRGPTKGTRQKVQDNAAPEMRGRADAIRISEALRMVTEGWTRVAAAEHCGVNVRTLYRAQKRNGLRDQDIEARSEATRLAALTPEQRQVAEAARFAAEREEARTIKVPAKTQDVLDDQSKRVPVDIVEFHDRYFGGIRCRQHLVHHPLAPFHEEMMRKIVDPATKRLMINVPYGHSKSTHGTLVTSLHAIAHDPNVQLGIASATTRLAERFVGQIRAFLSDPKMYVGSPGNLIEEAGPFVNETTGRLGNNQEFRVSCRQSIDRDPTVAAYGYGQEIQSTRLDRLYCDDLATRRNHRTPERVEQMVEDVTQDYVSRLDENGQLILIGTRVRPGDIYAHLEVMPAFEVIRYPCVLDYEQERTLWPEHFGYAAAMRQKGGMKPELWELVYQNSTFFADGGTFSQTHLDACHDPTRVLGQAPPGLPCFIGLDPAGDGPQAGYSAMVLVAVDRATSKRYLVDLVNVKAMKSSQMKSQTLDWCARYPVRTFAYENKGLQRQIFAYDGDFKQELNKLGVRMSDRVRTHDGGGVGGKYDPVWGIDAMSTPFHNGMWSLPWGEGRGAQTGAIETRRRVGELEEQLMRFPMEGAPTDLMMALWIAETEILLHLGGGRRRNFSEREREEPLPADIEARRRVHSRGEVREARARDFGYGEYRPPTRLVNVGPELEREILNAM